MWKLGISLVAMWMCGACGDITSNLAADAASSDASAPGIDADPNAPDADPNIDAPDPTPDANTTPDADTTPDAPVITPASGVDILLVIDDSGGMTLEQDALLGAMGGFLDELETQAGGELPSLHVGVVSTNLGAGGFSIGGCPGDGDGAILQNAPTAGGCSPPSDHYIVDEPDGVGGRTRNYAAGTLAQAIDCIGGLGTGGCGFEQPLEAMRRALNGTVPENAGFLRDDALLVVLVLTNEDDCSAADTELYNPSSPSLGPVSSFRCFEHGVACVPDEPTVPGVKTGCTSREDSAYTHTIAGYAAFLASLKPAGHVVFVAIHGDTSPVEVSLTSGGNPNLEPSCTSDTGDADPAIRLDQLTDGFGSDGIFGSLCTGFAGALDTAAATIAGKL